MLLRLAVFGLMITTAQAADYRFETTGPMAAKASQHRAIVMPSGDVLITGGQSGEGGIAETQLFDPITRTFSALPPMTEPRFVHAMDLLPDGRAFITGGFSKAGGFLRTTEFFDGTTFSAGPALLENRDNQRTIALSDGRIFIEGGDNEQPGYIDSTEIFDPVTGTLTEGPVLPVGRAMDSIDLMPDGRVFIVGGMKAVDSKQIYLTETLFYDPAANSLMPGPALNVPRKTHRSIVLDDGSVLITGGFNDGGELRSAELLVDGRFLPLPDMASARREHCIAKLPDDRIIVIGGYDGRVYSALTEIFDPKTRTWADGPTLAEGRAFHTCSKVAGGILVAGGWNAGGAIASAELLSKAPDRPALPQKAGESWPVHEPTEFEREIGRAEAARYRELKYDASHRSQDYEPLGDFLNYGKTVRYRVTDRLKLDEQGIPMTLQEGGFFHSPGTVAIYSLMTYGLHLAGEPIDAHLRGAEKLLSMQGDDGALRYPYVYRHYTVKTAYREGWISGMDQGLALSVYARTYSVTGDPKWKVAGDKALDFLQVPFPDGPMTNLSDLDPSLSDYIYFEEYLVDPHVYTLNGYVFTLLGLYDWWKVAGSEVAGDLFTRGIETLERILPYHDIGTFSTYDIGYITHGKPYLQPIKPHVPTRYHALHIAQLRALHSITGNETLKYFADRWQGYVGPR